MTVDGLASLSTQDILRYSLNRGSRSFAIFHFQASRAKFQDVLRNGVHMFGRFRLVFGRNSADQSISGGGIFVKVQGQSGKMTFASSEPIGSAADKVELASDGTVLGSGGRAKHSFNSFATQDFTFSNPVADTIKGVEKNDNVWVAKDYNVTKVSFTREKGLHRTPSWSLMLSFSQTTHTFSLPLPLVVRKLNKRPVQDPWSSMYAWASGIGAPMTVHPVMELVMRSDSRWKWPIRLSRQFQQAIHRIHPAMVVAAMVQCKILVESLFPFSTLYADGTVTDYSMPTKPSLTLSPQPGQENGASQNVRTLVLEFPRANFGANDTLIYDPMLSVELFGLYRDRPEWPRDQSSELHYPRRKSSSWLPCRNSHSSLWLRRNLSIRFGWIGKRGVTQSQHRRHECGRCLKGLGESFPI